MSPEFDAVPIWDQAQLLSERIFASKYAGASTREQATHYNPCGKPYYAVKMAKERARDYAWEAGCPRRCILRVVATDHMVWM